MTETLNKASKIVLRRFALLFEESGRQSLEDLEFNYQDIMDVLDDTEHYDDTTEEVMKRLEFEKCIKVNTRAGEEGSHWTRFVLTEKGFHIGLPEKHGGSKFYSSVIGSAFLFSLASLGIIGGPLALAGLLKNVISWSDPITWLINIWQSTVSTPIKEILAVPLSLVGVQHVPAWVGDYVAIGLLVSASTVNASRVQREYSNLPNDGAPVTFAQKIKAYSWLYLVNIFIWPINLLFELFFSFSFIGMYVFGVMSVKGKTALNKQMVFARFFTFIVPIVLFLLLFVSNAFIK